MTPNPRAQGFTLLELVIVLSILTLLTLLASRDLLTRQNDLRTAQSDRLLTQIQTAILGDPTHPNAPAPSFVADIGRLPRASLCTNTAGEPILALSELLTRPDSLPPFQIIPATTSNRCHDAAPHHPMDDTVFVPRGWRGPYLPLPPSHAPTPTALLLRDAWGNPLISHLPQNAPEITNNYLLPTAYLTNSNHFSLSPNDPIAAIRHLGSDGLHGASPNHPSTRDFTLSNFPENARASLQHSYLYWPTNLTPQLTHATIRLYGPSDSSPSQIMIWETNLLRTETSPSSPWSLDDPHITTGPRFLRFCLTTADHTLAATSPPFPLLLRRGPRQIILDARDLNRLDILNPF